MSRLDEKRFTALGQQWTARFDFNATCAIEDETGESFYAVAAPFLEQMDKQDIADPAKVLAALGKRYNSRIRLILFHALGGEDAGLDLKTVGQIITDIGLQEATAVVLWAIAKGIGGDLDEAEGNAPAAPKAPAPPNRKARRAAGASG